MKNLMISKMNVHIYTSISLIFLILCGCENGKNGIFDNEPDGFRDYKWGSKFDEMEGLNISDSVAIKFDLPYYEAVKPNENLDFYGTQASTITYYFEDDLLVSVMVSLPSKESFEIVKKYCFNVYGITRNKSKSKRDEKYVWAGEKTQIELSHNSSQEYPTYGLIRFISSKKEYEPEIEIKIDRYSYILDSMKGQLQYNKSWFCGFGRYLDFQEKYEYYNVYLCKLYDLSEQDTKDVFEEILKTGIVKPDYYYFSVFIEDSNDHEESSDDTLYQENEIGLFPNIDKCNELAQFALSHSIPIRQCRSWKSHSEYLDKLNKFFTP